MRYDIKLKGISMEDNKLIITEEDNAIVDNAMRQKKGELTLLKIFSAVIYAIIAVFLIYQLIGVVFGENTNLGLSLAVYLIVILLYLGSIANAVPTILSVIGLIITAVKRKRGEYSLSTLVYFIVFSILPYLTEGVLFLITYIITQQIQ